MERTQYLDKEPTIHATAYVAPSADIVGDVTLEEESSVWYQAVLRGDIQRIVIGPHSNVQDGCVVHLADDLGAFVGAWVTVGHRAIIHACTIDDEVLVGMGSVVLDGAEVGARSIIGAGAVVTQGKKIPPGSLVLGMPGKVVKTLSSGEQKEIRGWAERYVEVAREFREREQAGTLPHWSSQSGSGSL